MIKFFTTILYQPLYNLLIGLSLILPFHSMGLSIIIVTIVVRLILLPTSIKAARLQIKSMQLQPKINKIRSEVKNKHEQSQALMALYKEEGFSPFGSCLPLLIQFLILIVLFQVFKNGLETSGFSMLYSFIPRPESINLNFLGFTLTKPDVWVLPIIAAVLQIGLSYLMMMLQPKADKNSKDPMAMMNKQMLYLPAVMTLIIGRSMPSALLLYWIATTVFGIFQQLYINKQIKVEMALIKPVKTEEKKAEIVANSEPKNSEKSSTLTKIINKRLDKAEKKTGVNVTVRTKKK